MPRKKPPVAPVPQPSATLAERIYQSLPPAPEGCYWMLYDYRSEMFPCGSTLTLVLRQTHTKKFRWAGRDKILFGLEVFEPSSQSPWELEEELLLRKIGHKAYDINQMFLAAQKASQVRESVFGKQHAIRF